MDETLEGQLMRCIPMQVTGKGRNNRKGADTLARGEAPSAEPNEPKGRPEYAHTLTFRLTAQQYRRLRRFVTAHEERTDHKLAHQAVLQAALLDYIQQHENP
jgi:hypothetical protein